MQATEALRSAQDLPSDVRPAPPSPQQIAQQREATIYRMVVGTWMVLLIGFGILQLMGVLNVR